MKIAVIVSLFNEEKTIGALIKSLTMQSKRPDEIIFVDGGSSDKTCSVIKRFQSSNKNIRLLQVKSTRAEARNIGVRASKSDIIATTDAGCVAEGHWLERITHPFKKNDVGFVAGFYIMVTESHFKKALSTFLGIIPTKFNNRFLPSTRSLAFRKSVWKKVGGFPQELKDTAEDTLFNYKVVKAGVKIIKAKNAYVYWELPNTYFEAAKKMFLYAKGDARSGIWWHPVKKLSTHNIKITLVFLRYALGFLLLFMAIDHKYIWLPLVTSLIYYVLWSYRKVYLQTKDLYAGFYGIILQFVSDFSVMLGFLAGII